MNRLQLSSILKQWDQQGKYVFTKHELLKLFPEDKLKTLTEALQRHVRDGLITRACRAIYVNTDAKCFDRYTLERIASKLRSGYYNYVSLESALSENGVISQIPIDRLTVMSTGGSGLHETRFGVIEFTHTKRRVENILSSTYCAEDRPLRMAMKQAAWRDLKRVGRNTNLMNRSELEDD